MTELQKTLTALKSTLIQAHSQAWDVRDAARRQGVDHVPWHTTALHLDNLRQEVDGALAKAGGDHTNA